MRPYLIFILLGPVDDNETFYEIIKVESCRLTAVLKFMAYRQPGAHSLSPIMHNSAFVALGLKQGLCRLPGNECEKSSGRHAGLEACMASLSLFRIRSGSAHIDSIDSCGRQIGAVNTVVYGGRKTDGFEYRWSGATGPLLIGCRPAGRKVLSWEQAARRGLSALPGAKRVPAGRCFGQRTEKFSPRVKTIWSGTTAHATGSSRPQLRAVAGSRTGSIATSVGMHPNEDATLVPADQPRHGQVVFDVVYAPLETKMLREARSRGRSHPRR